MKPTINYRQQSYGALGDLTVENIACEVIARRFDFTQESTVCRHLVATTLTELAAEDARTGIDRVEPFVMRVDWKDKPLPVSLLDRELVADLVSGQTPGQVFRHRRETVFKSLLQWDAGVTMDDVRRILCPTSLLSYGRSKTSANEEPSASASGDVRMDLTRLRKTVSVPEELSPDPLDLPDPPARVLERLTPVIEQEGRSPEAARTLVAQVAALRNAFCPRLSDLRPGQLVAMAIDLTDRRMSVKTRHRRHVPVRLTLYSQRELATLEQLGPRDRPGTIRLLQQRVARLLTEAYCQGGLLSLNLVAILCQLGPGRIADLVNTFEADQQLVLPTPGTIHDAGSKLTHKTSIVRLHLEGLECRDIARHTFHTEDAVARYIDDFERTLVGHAYGVPEHLLPKLLKLGRHVVVQYLELVRYHIGDVEQVRNLLAERNLEIQEAVA